MKRSWIVGLTFSLSLGLMAYKQGDPVKAGGGEGSKPASPEVEIAPGLLAIFQPLPTAFETQENPITEAKVALGRRLYFDKRLSKNHDVSCNSCHNLETYGVDNKPVSEGHRKQKGGRNSPTVYNAAGHFVQFWDGRSPHVEHQAQQPILNPVEMAMPAPEKVVAVLRSIPGYVEDFKKAFPGSADPVTYDHLGKAIGAFERKLVTPSRWDRFLKGDKKALTSAEKKGFLTFIQSGCLACHMGPLVGGQIYQKVGLIKPWPNQKDLGRFEVTKEEALKMFFKVPSLRNIEKTAPYMHDGSVATLEEAVALMARHQVGRALSKEDIGLIVLWLKTLTGDLPKDLIKEPTLPPSGPTTPAPDPK